MQELQPTIFMYWTHAIAAEPPSAVAWRGIFHRYRLTSDDDIMPLLRQHDSELPRLFSRLAITSPKSDIARFAILYELGGLYLDAHVGPTSTTALSALFGRLRNRDLIVFDRISERTGPNDRHLITSAMCARPRLPLVSEVLRTISANLLAHERIEDEARGHVPYNIFLLTGPAVLQGIILDRHALPIAIKPEYRAQTDFLPLSPDYDYGFRLYRHYEYRKPGTHWSELQRSQRLFLNETVSR